MLHLWTSYVIAQSRECQLEESLCGLEERTRNKSHLEALPNHRSHSLCVSVPLLHPLYEREREQFSLSCLG
jgi:hypothetical protein